MLSRFFAVRLANPGEYHYCTDDLTEDTGRDFDCKLTVELYSCSISCFPLVPQRSKQSSLAGAVPGYWTNVAMLRENTELVEELYWQLSGNVTSWL